MRHLTAAIAAMAVVAGPAAIAQEKVPSASGAWVAQPPGATTALVYAVIDNPTMYEVFVVSVTCDAAALAEVVQGDAAAAKLIKELSVPAYGQTELTPGGVYIRLKDLKKPLEVGASVGLTLTMDSGAVVKVSAEVRKQ